MKRVTLEKTREESVPDPSTIGLNEDTLNPESIGTLVCRRSGRVVRPPDIFMCLGESYMTISKVHGLDPTIYSKTIKSFGFT